MFGTNNLESQDRYSDGSSLVVQNIFYTIQGEGPYAGMPAVFVRLWGCNLRCKFCDTDFESNKQEMTIGQILKQIEGKYREVNRWGKNKPIIVLTGGEPMRQPIAPLCALLSDYIVQIETAGTLWVEGLAGMSHVKYVCSPKTGKVHPEVDNRCMNWKYLIQEGQISDEDGLPDRSTQDPTLMCKLYRPNLPSTLETIWLQPCEAYKVEKTPKPLTLESLKMHSYAPPDMEGNPLSDQQVTSANRDEEQTRRNIKLCGELAMKYGYRVSLQMHKILGLP